MLFSSHKPKYYSRPPRAALAVGLLCVAVGAQAVERIQSLDYGAALFQFYQQDYFQAISELMVGQERQSLAVHAESAELLRGGMSLSYGMDRTAESVFSELISAVGSSSITALPVKDQAWFYLAKLAWQRGEIERTASSLGQISSGYQGKLRDELNYLRASVALRAGDEALAQSHAGLLPDDSPWGYYQAYNLGAGKAVVGEWESAAKHFDTLANISGPDTEMKRLKDRGMTAAGYAMMAAGKPAAASVRFSQVRLDNPEADRALLGYGWALSEHENYTAAISPWRALSERSPMSESVRQGLLALPYAYEKQGRSDLALAGYQQAVKRYNNELDQIDQAIHQFTSGKLEPLLGFGAEEAGSGEWLGGADLFSHEEPSQYLGQLTSRHSFQMALRELRDLQYLAGRLKKASERIAVMTFVDMHQQATWSDVIEGDRAQELARRHRELVAQAEAMKERLVSAEAMNDSRWATSPAQAALWKKLEGVEHLADELSASSQVQLSIELLRGLLIWQDSEDYPARSWSLRQQMTELDGLVEESGRRMASLNGIVANRNDVEFTSRINEMESRIEQQQSVVAQATQSSEAAIRKIAVEELQQQSTGLSQALAESKLAIARIYDQQSTGVLR